MTITLDRYAPRVLPRHDATPSPSHRPATQRLTDREHRNLSRIIGGRSSGIPKSRPLPRGHGHGVARRLRLADQVGERYEDIARALRDPRTRKAIQLVRVAGGAFPKVIDLVNAIDPIVMRLSQPKAVQTPGSHWTLRGKCQFPGAGSVLGWMFHAGHQGNLADACLAGQGNTGYSQSIDDAPAHQAGANHIKLTSPTSSYQIIASYSRVLPQTVNIARVQARAPAALGIKTMVNPNLHRLANPTPQPMPAPVRGAVRLSADTDARTLVITRTAPGRSATRLPPSRTQHRSKPPGARTQEKKSLMRKGMHALTQALDKASEGAEIIDAVYQSLPASVRKRWDRKDRPADQIGQYGVEGADWKLQAIYHNWRHVDASKAVLNIIKNEAEDKLHGASHKAKSKLLRRGRHRNGPPPWGK